MHIFEEKKAEGDKKIEDEMSERMDEMDVKVFHFLIKLT